MSWGIKGDTYIESPSGQLKINKCICNGVRIAKQIKGKSSLEKLITQDSRCSHVLNVGYFTKTLSQFSIKVNKKLKHASTTINVSSFSHHGVESILNLRKNPNKNVSDNEI
jgi:hypothetical protein